MEMVVNPPIAVSDLWCPRCTSQSLGAKAASESARDGKIYRLPNFVGTADNSPLPTDSWSDFLHIHRNYYTYYDRAVWLMGYASGGSAPTRVSHFEDLRDAIDSLLRSGNGE